MKRILHHVRGNAIAYLALFVALGGTSYAAVSLPANSVGSAQIKNHSITPVKFDNHAINGSVRAWAIVGSGGRVFASGGKPKVMTDAPYPGAYVIKWGVTFPASCATEVTIDVKHSPITGTTPVPGNSATPITAGYAVAYNSGSHPVATAVRTFNPGGDLTPLGFDAVLVC